MRSGIILATIALCAMPMTAQAHHSGAMFDQARVVELNGTVREFQWSNPHSFIQLVVKDGGSDTEWSVEMGSPSVLFRKGWKPRSMKPGDKVSVKIHPTRDGRPGGTLIMAADAAGHQIGQGA